MSGGGIGNMVSQMGQPSSSSGGFSNSGGSQQQAQPQMNWQTGQPVAQSTQPQFQPNTTGWSQPMFAMDPTRVSPAQHWWLGNEGTAATALENKLAREALPADQQAGYKPMTNQQALDQTLRNQIQGGMGNYRNMVNYANQAGVSTSDIQRAIGLNNDMYTYMNRPNYQQYSPNGQFNQPIYQSNYQNYNTGNAMGVSQYGQGNANPYGIGLDLMSTPFNPYSNTYQSTPFSAPTSQTYYPQVPQTNYGPSQSIVSRSAGMRGTPNVLRRAEGGIASLVDSVE